MLSPETMESVIHQYIKALNTGDLDAIVALYADDAVVEDPVGSTPKRGIADIHSFYAASTRMKLQVALDGEIRVAGMEAAFAFHVSIDFGGKRTTISPIDTFRFNEAGRIVHMRAFFGAGNTRVS